MEHPGEGACAFELGLVNYGYQYGRIKRTQYKALFLSIWANFRRNHHLNQWTKKVCPWERGWAPSNRLQAGTKLISLPLFWSLQCFLSSFPALGHPRSRSSGHQILGLTSAGHQAFRLWSWVQSDTIGFSGSGLRLRQATDVWDFLVYCWHIIGLLSSCDCIN